VDQKPCISQNSLVVEYSSVVQYMSRICRTKTLYTFRDRGRRSFANTEPGRKIGLRKPRPIVMSQHLDLIPPVDLSLINNTNVLDLPLFRRCHAERDVVRSTVDLALVVNSQCPTSDHTFNIDRPLKQSFAVGSRPMRVVERWRQ
jgi:hypothetical protein